MDQREAPATVSGYSVESVLGRNAFGEVHLARRIGAPPTERPVIVKRVINALSTNARAAKIVFSREVRLAGQLQHANCVRLLEFQTVGDDVFIVFEHLKGMSLHDASKAMWAEGMALPVELVLFVIAEAALGLHHAHTLKGKDGLQPLLHREVTPHNVFVTREGVSKVINFGFTRSYDYDDIMRQPEMLRDKMQFFSPEQIQGLPVDGRSDLFSLGVTLYWALTRMTPFTGKNDPVTVTRILERDPVPVRELNRHVSQEVEDFIFWLIEKNPDLRPKNALVVHNYLKQVVGRSFGTAEVARVLTDLEDSIKSRTEARRAQQAPHRDEITAARPWSEVEGMLAAVGLLQKARGTSGAR
jgi:serine/threonine-protein kinase